MPRFSRSVLRKEAIFYRPHPGLAGCTVPVPTAVLRVIRELKHQTLSLKEAMKIISAASPSGKITLYKEEDDPTRGSIFLEEKDSICIYTWVVLRFKILPSQNLRERERIIEEIKKTPEDVYGGIYIPLPSYQA